MTTNEEGKMTDTVDCPALHARDIARLERLLNIAATERDRLHSVLERARCILNNMAWENAGAIFNRWPIGHEPLRNDARNLLPEVDAALRDALEQTASTEKSNA